MKDWKREYFSIPNMLGYFRLVLAGIYLAVCIQAETKSDYYIAAGIIGISMVSDFLDGKIARRFHMVTPLGKALDPIADKLTQGALAVCLMTKYPLMIVLFALFLIKEGFMGITGLLFLRHGEVYGALWFGKICTVVLYAVMILLIFFPAIPLGAANTLILISIGFMLYSLIRYAILNINKLSGHGKRGKP